MFGSDYLDKFANVGAGASDALLHPTHKQDGVESPKEASAPGGVDQQSMDKAANPNGEVQKDVSSVPSCKADENDQVQMDMDFEDNM